VLTIAIPAQASPEPLPQDSTDPTVAMSRSNAELPSVEDPRVPPARTEAPGELEPTVPASHASETAPTVLATNAPSLPTEAATPASHTALVQLQQVAAIPSRPKARTFWKSWIIAAFAGITIFGLATYLSDLVYLNLPPNSPLANQIIPSWFVSPSWITLILGWILVVPFFFGARFGPWVGLCTAVIGGLLGDAISGYLAASSVGWYWYVAIAACGLFPGLAYQLSRGRNLLIRAALLFSLLGMSIYYLIGIIGNSISYGLWSYFFQYFISLMLSSLSALLLLLIALSVSNALGKNQIP